jgi:phosphoenolpyruvate carboxykinase (GTP)
VNYFLKDTQGHFLNSKNDKRAWLKWMELRVSEDVEALTAPTGYIPLYQDLVNIFKKVLSKHYSLDDYHTQFTIRIPENLAKIKRLLEIYSKRVSDTPPIVFDTFQTQKKRLEQAQKRYGDYISPEDL